MRRIPAGHSLVEAVWVLALAAIILSIGIPSFTGGLERQRVATAMHQLSADMAMARSSALMQRAQVVVCPGTPTGGCRGDQQWRDGWIVFRDVDGNRQPDMALDLLRVATTSSSRLSLVSTRPFLRFQADGRSAHSNLSIAVCAGGLLHGRVVVNRLGRVRGERNVTPQTCPEFNPGTPTGARAP